MRIIARLDIKNENVIKGINFEGLRVVGKPNNLAKKYYKEGADELIYSDCVASLYGRNNLSGLVKEAVKDIFIPITVAGGLRSIDDISECLGAGADKIAINTAAVSNPEFLKESVKVFGSQCIVASIETFRHEDGSYEIWTDYGREATGIDTFEWVKRVVDAGVGEIFLTSINNEGKGQGYDIELVKRVASTVSIPVIALGGAGKQEDLVEVVNEGMASAVAAASCYHYHYCEKVKKQYMSFNKSRLRMGKQIDSGNITFLNHGYGGFNAIPVETFSIPDAKKYMQRNGIEVRMPV